MKDGQEDDLTARAPKRHQPKNKSIRIRRGGSGRGCGVGTLESPASLESCGNTTTPHPAGDHKGPPNHTSSSLAPTDRPASCLICRLRLVSLGRPSRSPCPPGSQ